MPAQQRSLSFFGMVGLVMTALKLKQSYDEYKPMPTEDDESRIAFITRDGDDDSESLAPAKHKRRRPGCCICCGLDCTLFWKAFGIVLAGFVLWNSFKLIRWATTATPGPLDSMPAFSTSLGCLAAPHIYNSSKTVFTARIDTQNLEHIFDITGGAVGTVVIAEGSAELTDEIKYEMTLRTDDADLLHNVQIHYPEIDGTNLGNRLLISTPHLASPSTSCMRFDIKMFVPPNLKRLNIGSHTTTQIQFDSDANLDLDVLFVTLYSPSENNMILPNQNIRGHQMSLEVYRGWVVGDVSIVSNTAITTQRGDGVTNVRLHPTLPADPGFPEPASLSTLTGAGRTDIFYITPKAFKRPIHNTHTSSRNADMYLTYREAEYSGRIELKSGSYSATGIRPLHEEGSEWTHWVGDKDGLDRITVKSRGWTGLYF